MSARNSRICEQIRKWLDHHAPGATAALTGQDSRALQAFAHLLELYAVADDAGRRAAVPAMAHTVLAMQRKCWPAAKRLIPMVLDWGDEEPLWSAITARSLAYQGASCAS